MARVLAASLSLPLAAAFASVKTPPSPPPPGPRTPSLSISRHPHHRPRRPRRLLRLSSPATSLSTHSLRRHHHPPAITSVFAIAKNILQ